MDAGGQDYFDFLKPMLMQDRALVLLCVRAREEEKWAEQLREYLDVLSTLMRGGVVIPVITHADHLDSERQRQEALERWTSQALPVLQKFEDELEIDFVVTLVSSKTGDGVRELVQRLRENAAKVLFLFSALFLSSFLVRQLSGSSPRRKRRTDGCPWTLLVRCCPLTGRSSAGCCLPVRLGRWRRGAALTMPPRRSAPSVSWSRCVLLPCCFSLLFLSLSLC